jgi:hypothetical protein
VSGGEHQAMLLPVFLIDVGSLKFGRVGMQLPRGFPNGPATYFLIWLRGESDRRGPLTIWGGSVVYIGGSGGDVTQRLRCLLAALRRRSDNVRPAAIAPRRHGIDAWAMQTTERIELDAFRLVVVFNPYGREVERLALEAHLDMLGTLPPANTNRGEMLSGRNRSTAVSGRIAHDILSPFLRAAPK